MPFQDDALVALFKKYLVGDATYVDFIRGAMASVTEADVRIHNARTPRPADGGSAKGDAEWPFEG